MGAVELGKRSKVRQRGLIRRSSGRAGVPLEVGGWFSFGSRSQALPGNALYARLCLASYPLGRQSLPGSAFPGRAWERGTTEPGNEDTRKILAPKSTGTPAAPTSS